MAAPLAADVAVPAMGFAIITVFFRYGIYIGSMKPMTWHEASRWGGVMALVSLVLLNVW